MPRSQFCLAILLLAIPATSLGQILGFVPVTDSLFLSGGGDLLPYVSVTIDSSNSVIDSINVNGYFNVGHFNISTSFTDSTYRPRVTFVVRDSVHDSKYQMWMEQDSTSYPNPVQILFDQYTFVYPGESRLVLVVCRNGIAFDSMKVALLVQFICDVEESNSARPLVPMLQQNFPNPFNPETVIRFQLPVASEVWLAVYDILGREVEVLVNERMDAGVHEVKFDASGLASGVYFYRIQAGSYTETRKLILLR